MADRRGKYVDLSRQRFGRLLVIQDSGLRSPSGQVKWLCRCDCGNDFVVLGNNLNLGRTVSCGCRNREIQSSGRFTTKHGRHGTPEYIVWVALIQRCVNSRNKEYHNYGGRGISVCDRWRNSFEAFMEDMGQRPDGKSIDRIDNDGNYEPGNCRWATLKEQANNQRRISGNRYSALLAWCNGIIDDLPPSKRSARKAELEALISKKKRGA